MTNPKRAYLDKNGDRIYIGRNPKKKSRSVTTFLKTFPKPWLAPWAAKVTAEAATSVMEDVFYESLSGGDLSRILGNYIDDDDGNLEFDSDSFCKDLKLLHEAERDTAGDFGDDVHDCVEGLLLASKGNHVVYSKLLAELDGKYSNDVLYRASLVADFLKNHSIRIIEMEPTIYNDTLGYAGSADFFGYIDGVLCVVDIKTSRNWSDSFAPQVAAYASGEYYLTDNSDEANPMPHVERGAVLWIEPTRCRLIEVDISDDTMAVFTACKTLVEKLGSLPKLKTTIYDSKEQYDG